MLFGAAVLLIIGAALLVPWQRVQQLTSQLNEKAAGTVARTVLAQHTQNGQKSAPEPRSLVIDGQPYAAPRLLRRDSLTSATRFERSSINRFLNDADKTFNASDYQLADGSWGYRYAQALYARQECLSCHGSALAQAAQAAPAISMVLPTTRPAHKTPQFLGIVSVEIPSQISTNQLLLNHVFILTAGLLAGSLAIIIFYVITTRIILQPVRVLQETAEKVSKGDLNIRSDISTGDEFQQLSETLNTMLANLKTSSDQLRAVNKSLDMKLGQLAESNLALYESNRLKSEFLANVSHELRTPLNSILGFAELLRDMGQPEPDAKQVRYLQNILISANNLLVLINDLLDLAKIEAGKMEVRSEPLALADLFEALVNLLKPLTEQKALVITTSVSAGVPILQTDAAKLQQVLYNFLSNAIKFSPKAGTIEMSAERDGLESIRIAVADHGPGIEPDKHAVIFEKFRQIDGSVTREHGGSGLGLAISKELMLLLGGAIGVESTPGQGATFWITVPVKIEARAQDMRGRLVLT
jgi:two-component system, NarL family, sensor histidine kinase BarA